MKYLKITLPIILFTVMSCHIRQKELYLPDFNLLMIDSTTILNTSQIPEGKPFVMLYFAPDCDHCQRVIKDLLKNMNKAKDTKFYFFTANRFNELKAFNKEYKIGSFKNIVVGRDYELFMVRKVSDATPPYLTIYDKYKERKAVFAGEHSATKIIDVLHLIEG
jgi:thiol-disulfide isomerase/thioredoxin